VGNKIKNSMSCSGNHLAFSDESGRCANWATVVDAPPNGNGTYKSKTVVCGRTKHGTVTYIDDIKAKNLQWGLYKKIPNAWEDAEPHIKKLISDVE